ncbi:MAG: hypothetical protein MJY87_04350 [Fibrobacter sp.]|nr:hypothetical protein [Fibrobacter sp.]
MSTVNLNKKNRLEKQDIQVINERLSLEVPQEKAGLFGALFGKLKAIAGHYEISVRVNEHSQLVFKKSPIVFSDNGEYKSTLELDLSGNDTTIPVSLYFDPNIIEDCREKLDTNRQYTLNYSIVLSNADDKTEKVISEIDGKPLSLDVELEKFNSEPVFEIAWKGNANTKKIKYTASTENEVVGELYVRHNSSMLCAPAITNFTFDVETAKKGSGNAFETISEKIYNIDKPSSFTLNPGEDGRLFELRWDHQPTRNPFTEGKTECEYFIEVQYKKGLGQKQHQILQDKGITLLGNKTLTESDCYVELGNKRLSINHSRLKFSPIERLGDNAFGEESRQALRWVFENLAQVEDPEHPDASVLLWNLGASISIREEDRKRIKLRDSGKSIEDILKFTDENGNDLDLGSITRRLDYRDPKFVMQIAVRPKDFEDIEIAEKTSEVKVKIELRYNLLVDKDGDYSSSLPEGQKQQVSTVEFSLMMKPCAQWLSIDFGTSAVVANYEQRTSSQSGLIDLKSIKDDILKKSFKGDRTGKKSKNDDEEKYFINSMVCFNKVGDRSRSFDDIDDDQSIDKQSYDKYEKLSLWFSPSAGELYETQDCAQLPCLKMLMGYEKLPKLFNDTEAANISYGIHAENNKIKEVSLLERDPSKNPLILISNIFDQVYRQLFHYYIRRGKSTGDINKLVLSVPNTYTPVQIESLKKTAKDAIPTVYPEYLSIVSESDAVAYYYIANRRFFSKTDGIVSKEVENILIYDMGAGTLDLTYLSNKSSRNNQEINIIGKVGIPKAGNYLDYVLARIFIESEMNRRDENGIEIYTATDKAKMWKLVDLDKNASSPLQEDRDNLRNYIRNELKPVIAAGDESRPCPEFTQEFSIGLSIHHPKGTMTVADYADNDSFRNYIQDISNRIIDNLFATIAAESGKIAIDTVLFSGRSSSMKQVQRAVESKVRTISEAPDSIAFADIINNKLVKSVDQIENGDTSILKKIVTEGSLAFAKRSNNEGYTLKQKPFYAIYGVIVRDTEDQIEWIPLLTPTDEIKSTYSNEYEFSADVVSRLHTLYFVQTYSSHPKKDFEDWLLNGNEDHMDSTTILKEHACDAEDGDLTVSASFTPNSPRQLRLTIGANEINLNTRQDFDSVILRRSLWPVIFSNN